MDDILVHKKINNALAYPLLTKDILLNIEFKEPRIFYKEMLHSSLNPRLLYMHVMKETCILKLCLRQLLEKISKKLYAPLYIRDSVCTDLVSAGMLMKTCETV